MSRIYKYFMYFFVLLNSLILLSGNSWVYKGIAITYLKGHVSSYIEDFIHFPSNIIKSDEHQKWLISTDYNMQDAPDYLTELNSNLETVAFLIIQNDSIKYEHYWDNYSADAMSNSFSMAKSFVATLIGVALKEKKIKSLDQKVCDFIPEFCKDSRSNITIKHLLTMSSGLKWKEDYYSPLGQTAKAYYGNNLKNSVLDLKAIEAPGKIFRYHSCCTQILSFVLESAIGMSVSEYASEKLWRPMGAKHSALWSTDKKGGDEKGFCCINSNARDFARLGKLYLNNGNWKGCQIIDTSYVKAATKSTFLSDENGNKHTNYGYHFWVAKTKKLSLFYARGLWGQYIICIPKKNMIIVRLGRKDGVLLSNMHHDNLYVYVEAALQMFP